MAYLYLGIAIIAEVIATTALKASESFTRLWPSLLVIAGYCTAFYCMSLCIKTIDVGVVYAIWSGLGMVLITCAAAVFYKQIPDRWAIVGMSLIVIGVLVLNLLSKNAAH
jgi:small multidrug resistance pump